jgi:predicted anti-sigma-YlaC factor YlaD
MTCEELNRRLIEHEDGALQGDLCLALERHLAECSSCRNMRDDLRAIARLCQQDEPIVLPPDVRRRIEVLLASPTSR